MPQFPRRGFVLTLAIALGACTTVSVEERAAACEATDWENYGVNDGILGVAPDTRDEKFADCADLGVPADIAAYQAGRDRGLGRYCTLENGYDVGYSGRRYNKACPPALEASFLQGYEQGRKDRPVTIQPSIGFGLGFGFSHGHLWNHHHFHRHRYRSHRRSGEGS